MKKLITVLLTAILLVAGSAYATGTLADADKAQKSGNYAEAINIYKALALKGDESAQMELANMYENGHRAIQDHVEAFKWYKLAAEQGSASALMNLGFMYKDGLGVTKDLIKAHMCYNLAGAHGGEFAEEHRDLDAEKYRNLVAKEMTQQQIAQAQKLARECLARKYKGC